MIKVDTTLVNLFKQLQQIFRHDILANCKCKFTDKLYKNFKIYVYNSVYSNHYKKV